MLELVLSVPPLSTATVTMEFNRAFLKWTEHPPDAHHGFYIKCVPCTPAYSFNVIVMCIYVCSSAVFTTVLSDCTNCTADQIGGQQK